jgi:hypothetical protein
MALKNKKHKVLFFIFLFFNTSLIANDNIQYIDNNYFFSNQNKEPLFEIEESDKELLGSKEYNKQDIEEDIKKEQEHYWIEMFNASLNQIPKDITNPYSVSESYDLDETLNNFNIITTDSFSDTYKLDETGHSDVDYTYMDED